MGTSDRLKPVADDDDGDGGWVDASAGNKMVVEALSDNILSHCDAFLGSIKLSDIHHVAFTRAGSTS